MRTAQERWGLSLPVADMSSEQVAETRSYIVERVADAQRRYDEEVAHRPSYAPPGQSTLSEDRKAALLREVLEHQTVFEIEAGGGRPVVRYAKDGTMRYEAA